MCLTLNDVHTLCINTTAILVIGILDTGRLGPDTSSVSKKAAYNNICKTVQNRLRDMQDSWLSKKAEEIQPFADRKDMKKFHDALKTIYGPKSSGATPLLSANGSILLTDKDAILKRWAEHFNSVLNRPSSVNDNAINRLPQIECNVLLDEYPTVIETRKAIQHLSSGKAPGTDPAGGRTGLMVRASDSGSGDPGSILGRVGVFVSLSKRHLLPKSTGNTQE